MTSTLAENPRHAEVVVFGGGGMLATALRSAVCQSNTQASYRFISQADVDLNNAGRVGMLLESLQPQWVINLAAFTDVNAAETNRRAAFQINGNAVYPLARLCRSLPVKLLQLSTDYVFGNSFTPPAPTGWREHDPVGPMNAYGASKLMGEESIRRAGCQYLILRSSWLFAAEGKNFVRTMTKRLCKGETLKIIDDQIGRPTNCADLARTILQLTQTDLVGTFHATNAGPDASWYDLACTIRDVLELPANRVQPCSTSEFQSPAVRPAFSALDCTKLDTALPENPLQQNDWRSAVRTVVTEIIEGDRLTSDRAIEPKIQINVETDQLVAKAF